MQSRVSRTYSAVLGFDALGFRVLGLRGLGFILRPFGYALVPAGAMYVPQAAMHRLPVGLRNPFADAPKWELLKTCTT